MIVRMRSTLLGLLAILGLVMAGQAGVGQAEGEDAPFRSILLPSGMDEPSYIPPPPGVFGVSGQSVSAATASNILVEYIGFTPEAQAAFEFAVTIWESRISSPVTIEIYAVWGMQGSGVLGSAGSPDDYFDFPGALPATRYPSALANAIAGYDLDPDQPDISATFNSTFPHWYFGLDGQAPPGRYDLVTVVLHEIGHGLGISGNARFLGSGRATIYGQRPTIFDRLLENADGGLLIDYVQGSQALGAALTSGALYFGGPNAMAAAGGERPRIFAPPQFLDGSSTYHLDNDTYPPGNPDSLMTPIISAQEVVHDPGPITMGILADLGWILATPPDRLEFTSQPGQQQYANAALNPGISVAVVDAQGVPVTSDSTTIITLALTSGGGGALNCPGGLQRAVVAGIAAFSGCTVSAPGMGYTVVATSAPPYDHAFSAPFAVLEAPVFEHRVVVPGLGRH